MKTVPMGNANDARTVREASAALQKGKVFACPTDTVYGLIADAASRSAVQKVFLIKGREKEKALPIFVRDIAMAKKLARISPSQERFLRKAWPGKLTVVLRSRNKLPKELGTSRAIGLRIPGYPFVQSLLKVFGKPLTGTSANVSGARPISDSTEIISQFSRRRWKPDIVIEGGKLPPSLPSTVIDYTGKRKKVLRKGAYALPNRP